MSLAGLQSSYDPAAQFGSVTAGSVVSTKSLTVKGVPITGLLSSGRLETGYSGQTFVQTVSAASDSVIYGTSDLELETNAASHVATFEDVVTADASGSWVYSFPVPFDVAPTVEVIAAGGSAGPLLDYYDLSGASGFLRFAASQRSFLIRGSGLYTPAIPTVDIPPALHPSAVFPTTLADTGGVILRVQQFGSLTTPADLDPTKVCAVTASWAPVVPWAPTTGYYVVMVMSTTPITTLLQPSVNVGGFVGVPSGVAATDFATQPWNQYLTTNAKLQPSTTYYVSLLWDGTASAAGVPQTVQTKIDLQSIVYYSTGAPLAPVPMSAIPSSMTVSGGRTFPTSKRR